MNDRPDDREARRPVSPFHLLIAGALACLTIPRMTQPGMFLDGVTYAVLSRNLAEGLGSFWFPFYTATVYPQFHEQPPLGFALQGAAFALFGDHLAVERVYSVAMGALTLVLTILVWRHTMRDSRFDWLPVIFWLLPSTVTWAIVNNMLETTQAALTTMAVLAFVRSIASAGSGRAWSALAGVCVLAAVLTKGPVGLFPLAAPVLAALILPAHRSAAIRSGVTMGVTIAVGTALILSSAAARGSLGAYWDQQVVASIVAGKGGGGSRPLGLARHLGGGVIMRMLALLTVVWIIARFRASPRAPGKVNPWTWFFLALAFCGSVPVIVSSKIAGHYLVPSIPLFALGFAGLTASLFGMPAPQGPPGGRVLSRVAGVVGALLLLAAAALPILGATLERRDADWMVEYRSLAPFIQRGTTIRTCAAAGTEWGLHAYMQRFYEVSLDNQPNERRYFLQLTTRDCEAPATCARRVSTNRLALLECPARP